METETKTENVNVDTETTNIKVVKTETHRDSDFSKLLRPRLIETLEFRGCRDRDWAKVVETETFSHNSSSGV